MNSKQNTSSYKIFYPVFFISGACSLVYELIWVKMFIPIFGIGLYSVSAVVSSFMAGLALGSYVCARVIDYKKNLLKYYVAFELLIGIYAAILPRLINLNYAAMPFFYNNISSNFQIFSLFKFMFAFVLLIIPCSLMGATLPLMSRFLIISSKGDVDKDFSFLYALNTFGAACGCLIVTFFMLEFLGILTSSYVVSIINMLIGVFAYLYSLRHRFDYPGLAQKFLNTTGNEVFLRITPYSRNILFVAFLSGFYVLSFEILLVRALITFLPNDVYLFPVLLMTILIATSVGSFLNSLWVRKFKNYSLNLCISMVMSGFILAVTLRYLPFHLEKFANWYMWAICLIAAFPASLFIGVAFPSIVALYSSGIKSIGHDVGNVYSMNTWGALLGSFLTAFIFIPSFGLRNTLFFCLILYIVTGEAVFILTSPKIKSVPALLFTATLSTVLLINQLIPVNLFKDIFIKNSPDKRKLVFYKEGIVSSVGVFKGDNLFTLRYSDRAAVRGEISQTGPRRAIHRLKAHIPMMLHENPRRVINIGLGTGISAHSLTLHNIDRADNVEICRETMEAVRFFIDNPENLFNSPKTNLIVDDGRNFLFVTKEKYDVIFVYVFIYQMENIHFYTKDFLQLCKSKLNPGGLISVTLTAGGEGENFSLILLKTFLEVFSDAALFSASSGSPYLEGPERFLVGSDSESGLNFSSGYLEERFQSLGQEARAELSYAGINNAKDLLRHLVANYDSLIKLSSSAGKIITDNKTILDYQSARKRWTKIFASWLRRRPFFSRDAGNPQD